MTLTYWIASGKDRMKYLPIGFIAENQADAIAQFNAKYPERRICFPITTRHPSLPLH